MCIRDSTNTHTHTRTHARTRARAHTHMHTHTRTRTRTHHSRTAETSCSKLVTDKSDCYQAFLLQLLKVVKPALITLNRWNRDQTISYSVRMHPMFTLPDGSPSIYSPKATTLRQEIRAVCENQLISSHRFAQHLKQ